MPHDSLAVVWKPEDTHDVFARCQQFHATQAASEVVVDVDGLVIR